MHSIKQSGVLLAVACAAGLWIGAESANASEGVLPAPEGWVQQQAAAGVTVFQSEYPDAQWWEAFGDSQLNALVENALAHSPSLAVVEARINEAKGQQQVASSRLKPQAQVGVSYAWQYYSKSQFPFALNERIFQLFSAPLQAGYEVDWLGQARNQRAIAIKGVEAAKLQYHSARLALANAVVSRYVQWAAMESLICLHTQWVEGLTTLHAHAHRLLEEGQQPVMTLRDAEAALAVGKAQLANDEAMRAEIKHQLAVLLGQTPAQFEANAWTPPRLELLTVLEAFPAGVPATLLDHRPDMQLAETALEAAEIQIKVAKKSFYPRITLTGQTGFTSLVAHRWLTLDALSSALTPAISAPLLSGGVNKGRLTIAKAQRQQALNQYLDTFNTACSQVETALARVHATRQTMAEQMQRQGATSDKVNRVKLRYEQGLDSAPTFWLATLDLVPATSDAIVQRAQLALETVSLMTTLGGGALKEP
ncbi:MAG: efflux transporter outer membrane subunit [Vampirovibrionales bacterium]